MINPEELDLLKKTVEKLNEATRSVKGFREGFASAASKAAEDLAKVEKRQGKLNEAIERAGALSVPTKKEFTSLYDSLDSGLRATLGSWKKFSNQEWTAILNKLSSANAKASEGMRDEFLSISKAASSASEDIGRSFSKAFTSSYNDAKDYLNKVDKGFKDLSKEQQGKKILEFMSPSKARDIGDVKNAGTVGSRYGKGDLMQKALGSTPGMGGMSGTFGKVKGMAETSRGFLELSKGMAAAQGSTSTLVGAISLVKTTLASLGKAGVIGLIIAAVSELVKLVSSADKYIKDLNQTFASIAGPGSSIDDVQGRMKEFNDALFDISRNLKLGIKAKDASELFQTMAKSGLSMQGLSQRVGSYGESIETARKLSLQFGVSMQDMGRMMADQMLELRSSLDDVRKTFGVMAYDAAKAGIESNKFYQSVDAATSSLSFYGNFLQKASGMMRDFVSTGTMGFKDASQQATDMMGIFKNMSIQQRRGIAALVGPKDMQELFGTELGKLDGELGAINAKIKDRQAAEGKASGQNKNRIRDEIKVLARDAQNIRSKKVMMDKAHKSGDLTDIALAMPHLAAENAQIIAKIMKKNSIDIFGNMAAPIEYLTKQLGMNVDTATRYVHQIHSAKSVFEDFNETFRSNIGLLSDSQKDNVAGLLDAYKSGKTSEKDLRKGLTANLTEGFKKAGMLERLDEFINVAVRSGKSSDIVNKVISGSATEGDIREGTLNTTSSVGDLEGSAELTNEKMDDLIKATTPLQDYLDISKDAAKYALAGSNVMENMSMTLIGIFMKADYIAKMLSRFFDLGAANEETLTKKYAPEVKTMSEQASLYEASLQDALKNIEDKTSSSLALGELEDLYSKWASGDSSALKNRVGAGASQEDLEKLMGSYRAKKFADKGMEALKQEFGTKHRTLFENLSYDGSKAAHDKISQARTRGEDLVSPRMPVHMAEEPTKNKWFPSPEEKKKAAENQGFLRRASAKISSVFPSTAGKGGVSQEAIIEIAKDLRAGGSGSDGFLPTSAYMTPTVYDENTPGYNTPGLGKNLIKGEYSSKPSAPSIIVNQTINVSGDLDPTTAVDVKRAVQQSNQQQMLSTIQSYATQR